MGLIKKILINNSIKAFDTEKKNNTISNQFKYTIHQDIQNYLWIGDGEQKNYNPELLKHKIKINIQGAEYDFFYNTTVEEPSLIYMKLPVADTKENVEKPQYFPTYKDLTPEQKGVYWKLLANPYDKNIDIGYVFILYYGLERYLLTEDYENVIDLIIKLREYHKNNSFHKYTANVILLISICNQRADIAKKFIESLNVENNFLFSPNIYLLCKYCLNMPITDTDIMRLAKEFGFKKNIYINGYPELFQKNLSLNIVEKYGTDTIQLEKIITVEEYKNLPKEKTRIFANISIIDKTIELPKLLDSSLLNDNMLFLLNKTHEDVKRILAQKRRGGEKVLKKDSISNDKKEVLSFDVAQERVLLEEYKRTNKKSLDCHFALISLQKFYYKYRDLDKKYLEECIRYCREDIEKLYVFQKNNIADERRKILSNKYLTLKEKQKEIHEIEPFYAEIPAFKRLAIIYEKEKDYDSAIKICKQAIAFYGAGKMESYVSEFSERINKMQNRMIE